MNRPRLLVLFGSHAKNQAAAASDIDIAALGARPFSERDKERIRRETSRRLHVGEEKIDLIDLLKAPPLLRYEIAQSGTLLAGSPFDWTRFRVLAWKQYLDTEKLRRLREQSLKRKLNVKSPAPQKA